MLGLLVLVYAGVAYAIFLGAVRRSKPNDTKTTLILGSIAALLFGPLILLGYVSLCVVNPKYRPRYVEFIEMEYDPETREFHHEGTYSTVWLSEADGRNSHRVA